MKKILAVLATPLIALGLTLTSATQGQAVPASTPFPGAHCGGSGSFRWPVKTGADADRFSVNTTPSVTTVSALKKLPPPTQTALDSSFATNHRINPAELQVWQITGVMTTLSLNRSDSDLHTYIQDSSGHHVVVEIPWPGCVSSLSPWLADITTVRNYLDALYPTTVSNPSQTVNRTVTLTGIGFFDHAEQSGQRYYHIELHPVISLSFS